jgi:hypothetical protein
MHAFRYFLFMLMMMLLWASCAKEDKATINKAQWSSRDPLNIPLNRRMSELKSGNMVLNPSFERGRFFNDQFNTFELPGWTEIGNATVWVDISKEGHQSGEVSSGSHAIRISRDVSDEVVQQGAGMLSDFIKVIPGNYRLNYSLRVEDLSPYTGRLGSRLQDALNVRIYYYDKNKIRIGGAAKNPVTGIRFDNEFKALPFSGYWKIDSLGWLRTRGISHKFPFADGDLPENPRYIRIYFGLKGPGTIWVDDVDFRYTHRNFSLYERLKHWQDSTFSPYDLLVPQPKHMQPGSAWPLFDAGGHKKHPVVVIAPDAGAVVKQSADLLRRHLAGLSEKHGRYDIPVVAPEDAENIPGATVVFSLGDNVLARKYRGALPYDRLESHSQGYFIHSPDREKSVVVVAGNEPVGTYYGTTTLLRLLDAEDLRYHHAGIVDYPDMERRGIYWQPAKDSEENLNFLSRNRFNRILINTPEHQNGSLRSHIAQLGDASLKGKLFGPGLSLRPPLPQSMNWKEQPGGFATEKDVNRVVDHARNHHFSNLVLRMDQVKGGGRDSRLPEIKENVSYNQYRNLLDIHSRLIRNISERAGDDLEIGYMPFWHNNRCIIQSHGRGEMFLKEFFRKVPPQVDLLWSGPVEHPLLIDPAETAYIRELTGKKPVFYSRQIHPLSMETFINAYPGKARMSSLFRHFIVQLPDDLTGPKKGAMYAHLSPVDALDRIRAKTLSSAMWNARGYDPDITLLRVLVSEYGHAAAMDLLRLNDAYFGLREMFGKIRSKETKAKFVRSAENFKRQVDELIARLKPRLEDTELWPEIEQFEKKAEAWFQAIASQ